MGGIRRIARLAVQRGWLGALIAAAVLISVLVEPRAQQTTEDAQVIAADESLAAAMRAGDKSIARKLLSLQFTFVDENGKIHARKDFLADLKAVAAAPATDVTVKIYGVVAVITGHRKSARGSDVFFLDIWAKQKRAWRALTMQDVVLASTDTAPADPARSPEAKTDDCKNPCQTIPYRVRSPAEQDVVNAFQAIERASIAHNVDEWSKHIADEFVDYRSGHVPIPKAKLIAIIRDQKDQNIPAFLTAIQSMRLWVYGDGAAMISINVMPDDPEPILRIARVWVRRNGQWQMAISAQTAIKSP